MPSRSLLYNLFVVFILLSTTKTSSSLSTSSALKSASSSGFGKAADPMLLHTLDTSQEIKSLSGFVSSQPRGLAEKKCSVAFVKGGVRGLVCTKPVKKDEVICSIPSSIALALSDPASPPLDTEDEVTEAAKKLKEWYFDDSDRLASFAPYIASLPDPNADDDRVFSRTPDFFDDEALEALEMPGMLERVRARKEAIKVRERQCCFFL